MITRGITVLFLFLITFVISCSAQCDCYAYWVCNGPATIVYPDQCSTGPPDYYGAGAVLDGSTGLGDTYLIHTTNPDQAYRLIGDCVEHVTFGNCPTAPEQIRTDLSIEYTCDETALCLADEPTPASLSTYTFDQSGATIGCNNTCFSLATNCTVTESLVPNACLLGVANSLDWCIDGNTVLTSNPFSIELTFDIAHEASAAWINQPFDIVNNGFTISATVQVTNNGQTTPADGFAFVVQQDNNTCNSIGVGGGGIGYDYLYNAFVVEFDDFYDPQFNDPDNHHIGVQASPAIGEQVDVTHNTATTVIPPITVAPIAVPGGTLFHTILIQYVAATTTLIVIYDFSMIINQPITAISNLNLDHALVGFTASTGDLADAITITNVQFSSP